MLSRAPIFMGSLLGLSQGSLSFASTINSGLGVPQEWVGECMSWLVNGEIPMFRE
jgi:hypothetical protein